jgi:ubiquinone/menaquinone biosynthesis C-methylase UbiE
MSPTDRSLALAPEDPPRLRSRPEVPPSRHKRSLKSMNVTRALRLIARALNIDAILGQTADRQAVLNYYNASKLSHWLSRSQSDAMHMALNYDNRFDRRGYIGQAKLVEERLPSNMSFNVLEVACGNGYNSVYLGRQHPEALVCGIDLAARHVRIARRRARTVPNLSVLEGDFERIPLADESFHVVFAIEAISQAQDMNSALRETYRVLKANGILVITDVFRNDDLAPFSDVLRVAAKITDISAVRRGWARAEWLALAQTIGFQVAEVVDLSNAVMPNLVRFQKNAYRLFRSPFIARQLIRILPSVLVQDAIAGLLMPLTVKDGAHSYNMVVLRRPALGDEHATSVERGNMSFSYRDYVTTKDEFPTWPDATARALRMRPAPFATMAAASVFVIGFAIALSVGFEAIYIRTTAVWIGVIGIFWVLASLGWVSVRVHTMFEILRPIFMVTDREYSIRLRSWGRRTIDTPRNMRASLAAFALVVLVTYLCFYDYHFVLILHIKSLKPIWFPPQWYYGPGRLAKVAIILLYGAAAAILLGTTFRMVAITVMWLYDFRNMPTIPIANLVRARLSGLTNLYVRSSIVAGVGAGLFAVLFIDRFDWFSISVTIMVSLAALALFFVPQLIFRSYLMASYDTLCRSALRNFYKNIGVKLTERPPFRHAVVLDAFYDAIAHEDNRSDAGWGSIADLVSATERPLVWVYDLRDMFLLVLSQSIAVLSVILQVLSFK